MALASAGGCSCDAAFATVVAAASFEVLAELLFGLVLDGALFGLTTIVLRPLVVPAVLAALPPALVAAAVEAVEAEGNFFIGAETFAPAPTVSVAAFTVTATLVDEAGAAADVGGAFAAARAALRDPASFSGGTLSRADVGAEDGAEAGAEAGADPVATGTELGERLVVLASAPPTVGGTEAGATLVFEVVTATGFISVLAAFGSVLV